jgi:hypothetical protein
MQNLKNLRGTLNVGPDNTTWVEEALGPQNMAGVKSELYTWTPPPSAQAELPPGSTLVLRCATFPDGVRRLYPDQNFDLMISIAFGAGLGISSELANMEPEQRQSERLLWFLFQRVRATKEHFKNKLLDPGSLKVSRSGRGVAVKHSILPDDVGLEAGGQGESWGIGELLKEGREEALKNGIDKPSSSDLLHYGLFRAAKHNPLEVADNEVPGLLRQALYDIVMLPGYEGCRPKSPCYDEATRKAVVERIWQALRRHLEDPPEQFNKWFLGPNNSFVAQIAKIKRAPRGKIGPEIVRQILLDLGWEAHQRVGACVDVAMETVFRSIKPPLIGQEKEFYQQLYLKQPHFGNVPFVLWVGRFPFIRAALWDIWANPGNRQNIAVIHRLLYYYGVMVTERRDIDRLMKARKSTGGPSSRNGVEVSFDLEKHERPKPDSTTYEKFEGLSMEVRSRQGVQCKCPPHESDWVSEVSEFNEAGEEVTIDHTCRTCGTTEKTVLSVKDLKTIVEEADIS